MKKDACYYDMINSNRTIEYMCMNIEYQKLNIANTNENVNVERQVLLAMENDLQRMKAVTQINNILMLPYLYPEYYSEESRQKLVNDK